MMVFLGVLVLQLPERAPSVVSECTGATAERNEINRTLANYILMDREVLFEGARLVPSLRDGAMQGFKVYAIRPGSLPDVLGFRSGDTFHRVAEEQSHLRFDITRRGISTSLLVAISES